MGIKSSILRLLRWFSFKKEIIVMTRSEIITRCMEDYRDGKTDKAVNDLVTESGEMGFIITKEDGINFLAGLDRKSEYND